MMNLIKVELMDGTVCRMAPKALTLFLTQKKVVKFMRSDGWAVVGLDPLRGTAKKFGYYGIENRVAV